MSSEQRQESRDSLKYLIALEKDNIFVMGHVLDISALGMKLMVQARWDNIQGNGILFQMQQNEQKFEYTIRD